ncbi:MAG TPA: hypothetical protein VM598_01160 [Bdellovibrionota bacterium]|nr:hypothetical protein [Bdellovibrionota bacterium]
MERALRYLWAWIGLLTFGLLACAVSEGQIRKQAPRPLRYLPELDYISGLSQSEATALHSVLEDQPIIDLQTSGLGELHSYLVTLNTRLTDTRERNSTEYPDYRLHLIADDGVTAYIYKHREAGARAYRGHVFVSIGLLRRMAENLGVPPARMTGETLQLLIRGLRGVIAHEFAHPKQDRLVKWQWRSDQGRSLMDHAQGDELTTDFLAGQLGRDASLTDDMALALQLIYEEPRNRSTVVGTVMAAIQTHPEDKARINFNRAARFQRDLTQGRPPTEEIPYDEARLIDDFEQLLGQSTQAEQSRARLLAMPPDEAFLAVLTELRLLIRANSPMQRLARFGPDLVRVLAEIERSAPPSPERKAALLDFFRYCLEEGLHLLSDKEKFTRTAVVRDFQAAWSELKTASDPALRAELRSELSRRFLPILAESKSRLHGLAQMIPRDVMTVAIAEGITRIRQLEGPEEIQALYRIWAVLGALGTPPALELAVVGRLREIGFDTDENRVAMRNSQWAVFRSRGAGNVDWWADRGLFHERFVRYAWTHPVETAELRRAYVGLLEDGVRGRRVPWFDPNLLEVAMWEYDGAPPLAPWAKNQKFEVSRTVDRVFGLLVGPEWQAELAKMDTSQRYSDFLRVYDAMISQHAPFGSPMTSEQRLAAYERLLDLTGPHSLDKAASYRGTLGTETFEGRGECDIKIELTERLLLRISRDSGIPLLEAFDRLITSRFFGGSLNPGVTLNRQIELLLELRRHSHIDLPSYRKALAGLTLDSSRPGINVELPLLNARSATEVGLELIAQGRRGTEFVKAITAELALERDAPGTHRSRDGSPKELKDAATIRMRVDPAYSSMLSKISRMVAHELGQELGYPRRPRTHDAAYVAAFRARWPRVEAFVRAVFDPDGVPIPPEHRGFVKYTGMSDLAGEIVPWIPSSALTLEQNLALWELMATKAPGRHSDSYFARHVEPGIEGIPLARQKSWLEHGLFKGERLKVRYLERVLEPELESLEKAKQGRLTDPEVRALAQRIRRWVPATSGHKDEFLRKLEWRLELSEPQLVKFTEPMKTSNWKGIDPLAVHAWSAASVVIESLTEKDKFGLLEYILDPSGEIADAIPGFARRTGGLVLRSANATGGISLLERLALFIRDAGDSERLLLNEMIIGSHRTGLWHTSEANRQRLMGMLNLSADAVTNLRAYADSLGEDGTFLVSQALALAPERNLAAGAPEEESFLLRVAELHKAPGVRSAQTAAILGLPDEESARPLEKAKSRLSPPTRLSVYERMRQQYTPEQMRNVRLRSLRGSGAVKDVAFVEVLGTNPEVLAAGFRKPHFEATTNTILDMIEGYTRQLRTVPGYENAFDYDYLISLLRQQLMEDGKLTREIGASNELRGLYARQRGVEGWTMVVPESSTRLPNSDEVVHFQAIQGAVGFEQLSPREREIVSEMIVAAETDLLLAGVFDADRQIDNYLFVPGEKRIYVIDTSQLYRLSRNGILVPGDRFFLASILHGLESARPADGAEELLTAFSRIATNAETIDPSRAARLKAKFAATLGGQLPRHLKVLQILGALSRERVNLPLRFSLGAFKILGYLSKEKYAAHSPPGLMEAALRRFVIRELVLGQRFRLEGFRDCIRSLTPRRE